jgi:hypothetical protein
MSLRHSAICPLPSAKFCSSCITVTPDHKMPNGLRQRRWKRLDPVPSYVDAGVRRPNFLDGIESNFNVCLPSPIIAFLTPSC